MPNPAARRALNLRRTYTRHSISKRLAAHRVVPKPHVAKSKRDPTISINPHRKVLEAFGFHRVRKLPHKQNVANLLGLIKHGRNAVSLSEKKLAELTSILQNSRFFIAHAPGLTLSGTGRMQRLVRADYDVVLYKEAPDQPFRLFVGAKKKLGITKIVEDDTIVNFIEGRHPAIVNPRQVEQCIIDGDLFALYPHKPAKGDEPAFEVVRLDHMLKAKKQAKT